MDERRAGTRCAVCTYCGACFRDEEKAARETTSESAAAHGDASASASASGTWSGTRCDVCRGCGKCLREWGLFGADAESGATSWAEAFKGMADGARGTAPNIPAPPGAQAPSKAADAGTADATSSATANAEEAASSNTSSPAAIACADEASSPAPKRSSSPFATLKSGDDDTDTSTGATPGVSSACKEFGMGDSFAFAASLGIKPPGQA